jgi:CPA1 family monovalent cation:H+ antiporter
MRGVISLAAAISLPETLANGSPFPQRNLIIFLTFTVILTTLVIQGLTLPALIRALGLAGGDGPGHDAAEARRLVIKAALEHLATHRSASPEFAEVDDDIAHHYSHRLDSLKSGQEHADGKHSDKHSHYLEVSRQLLNVERETALRLHGEGRISSEALRDIERDLDLSATRLNSAGVGTPDSRQK